MTLKQIEERPKKAPKQSITTKKDETKTRIKLQNLPTTKSLKSFFQFYFSIFHISSFTCPIAHCMMKKPPKNILKNLLDEEKKIFLIKQKLK